MTDRANHIDADDASADGQRFDDLLPVVYGELHALAQAVLHRTRTVDPTCTTSLINDVYVRLGKRGLQFRDRPHFLRLAARAMRMVLIDRARRANASKRGGTRIEVALEEDVVAARSAPELLTVEAAVTRLAGFDERKSRIVELRFYGGYSLEETAEALCLSVATVKREWTLARAWLCREINGDPKSS